MQICKSDNSTQKEWETIFFINNKIFGLNEGNLSQTVNLIINKFNYIYPLSFNMMICQMIYSNLYARINDFDVYFNFLKEIKKLEEENQIKPNIFDVFVKLILDSNMNESYYLLEKMLENNYIDFKFIKNNKRLHFINYLSEEEIIEYYKELSKNDLELQKKYVKEGINPNEIAKIIRNDEIEKLQDISSQTKFDFNQEIEPSLYERCSFVYDYVSLIDYAAFFGSVKCFKHLLMNGAIVENTGKYAVASGNIEIIHLCKQNHSSFKGAYEAAIRFHRNDIFHYVYEKKMKKINLEKLGIECILYNNYEIFSFLLKEGMKINEDIIHVSTKIGNIFLVKHFLDSNHIPIDILISSSESRNVELVKYILDQEEIDINAKDIYMFYIKFILIL